MQRTKIIIVFSILVVLIIFSVAVLGNKNIQKNEVKSRSISGESISKIQLTSYLEEQDVVKALPKDAQISIKPYNFNTGERQWESEYKITGDVVQEGKNENPDVSVWIHSKYLTQLKENNFCDVIKQAKQNGDFAFDTNLSKTKLLWKYKSMLKYEKCFG